MIWQHAQFLTAKSRKYEEALFEFKCQKNNGKLEKWYHQLANMQVLKYTSDSVKSQKVLTIFYTPVFRRDVLWYGDVRPGLRPSGSPSVRLSVRPSIRPSGSPSVRPFSALFSYILWHIELKFRTWLCFDVPQIKFDCRHFVSIFEGVMPLCELRI